MRRRGVGVLLLALMYGAKCFLGKLDGGATRGMPSESASRAFDDGMLVKRVTVLVDSGGPSRVSDAWIEIGAGTVYRWGVWATRRPLHHYGEGADTLLYLLAVAVPPDVDLEGTTKSLRGEDAVEVQSFDIVPPLPDTIRIRAREPGRFEYPVVFSGGQPVRDDARARP